MHEFVHDLGDRLAVGAAVLEDLRRPAILPLSDRMTWALSSLTPGIVLNCLTASRKQASPASASRSISAMAASSASTQFDLDERRRLPAALAERRVGCAHVEARELRHLCRQEVEHFVLPPAAINDVAGIDPRTALQPQRLGPPTPPPAEPCNPNLKPPTL